MQSLHCTKIVAHAEFLMLVLFTFTQKSYWETSHNGRKSECVKMHCIKGPVCKIKEDLLAEIEYDTHKYVLISV